MAACNTPRGLQPEDIPTRASINDLATSVPLTENAPPTPFNGVVDGLQPASIISLTDLSGWRYVVQLNFSGRLRQYAASGERFGAGGSLVQPTGVGAARHQSSTSGELIGQTEDTSYEAVRLGPDAFLVRGGTCLSNATTPPKPPPICARAIWSAGSAAPRRAASAPPSTGRMSISTPSTASDLVLPSIRIGDNGTVTLSGGEMWISPAHNAVVRFYLNLDVD